jgi:hypothetical protein
LSNHFEFPISIFGFEFVIKPIGSEKRRINDGIQNSKH